MPEAIFHELKYNFIIGSRLISQINACSITSSVRIKLFFFDFYRAIIRSTSTFSNHFILSRLWLKLLFFWSCISLYA